jgi:hypothetical protein
MTTEKGASPAGCIMALWRDMRWNNGFDGYKKIMNP